jgi:uncharacterized protein YdeI (YjbR/CyaY-like superfamily)
VEVIGMKKILEFKNKNEFSAWLEKNHDSSKGISTSLQEEKAAIGH